MIESRCVRRCFLGLLITIIVFYTQYSYTQEAFIERARIFHEFSNYASSCIIEDQDGSYLLLSNIYFESTDPRYIPGKYKPRLIKLDREFNILWHMNYDDISINYELLGKATSILETNVSCPP